MQTNNFSKIADFVAEAGFVYTKNSVIDPILDFVKSRMSTPQENMLRLNAENNAVKDALLHPVQTAHQIIESAKEKVTKLVHNAAHGNASQRGAVLGEITSFFGLGVGGGSGLKYGPRLANTSRLEKNFDSIRSKTQESNHLVSGIRRVSSDEANAPFITKKALAEGWHPPYPPGLSLREVTITSETKFYRVHTDPGKPMGRFLARESEIAHYLNNPEALRMHLGLPEVPIYITEVNVPSGTTLLSGRIGPQPAFGLIKKSGFQYQLMSDIPKSSFVNTKPILEPQFQYDLR